MLKRWHADAHYNTESGTTVISHDFEELEELHDLIEAGPDWTTVDRIEVRYAGGFIDAGLPKPQRRLQLVKG
jgi:hypothetical protein